MTIITISYSCTEQTANQLEFYAEVEGGIAPYKVDWWISATTDTTMADQKETDIFSNNPVDFAGNPSVDNEAKIVSFALPNYYVTMRVTDDCGQEVIRVVKLSCDENAREGQNQLSFEVINGQPNTNE